MSDLNSDSDTGANTGDANGKDGEGSGGTVNLGTSSDYTEGLFGPVDVGLESDKSPEPSAGGGNTSFVGVSFDVTVPGGFVTVSVDFGAYWGGGTLGGYAAGEIGFGLDYGVDIEWGTASSPSALSGLYSVTEFGFGPFSWNSTSGSRGKSSAINTGFNNGWLPSGHGGIGYCYTFKKESDYP